MKIFHLNIFLFFFFFITPFLSYSNDPLYINYTIKDGLPSNEIYKIIKDSKGYIWIASDGGITRFDGKNFKTFNEKNGLTDAVVFEIYEDFKGRIWFSTLNQKIGYIQTGKVHMLNMDLNKFKGKTSFVKSLYVDRKENLWIGTIGNGYVFKVSPPFTKPILLIKHKNRIVTIENHIILSDQTYAVKNNKQVWKSIHFENNKIKNDYSILLSQINTKAYSTFYFEDKNTVYLGLGKTLFKLKSGKLQYQLQYDELIISIHVFEDRLFVGTRNLGLLILNKKTGKLITNILSNITVSSVVKDNENNFWISTLEKGLILMPNIDYQKKIKEYRKIKSLTILNENHFYALSSSLKIIEVKNNSSKVFPFIGEVSVKLTDDKSKLLVGSNECGILDLKKNSKIIFKDSFSISNFKTAYIHNSIIYGLTTNYILVNKDGKYLSKLCFSKNKLITFKFDKIRNGFWVSDTEGLSFLDLNGNRTTYYKKYKFIKTRINEIELDVNNNLWLATKGQGVFYIKNEKEYKNYNIGNGLLSDFCKSIEIDNRKNCWISTSRGINLIQPKKKLVTSIDLVNKFVHEEITDLKCTSRSLFISTEAGVLHFKNFINQFYQVKKDCFHLDKFEITTNKSGNYSLHFKIDNLNYSSFNKWKLDYRIKNETKEWTRLAKNEHHLYNISPGNHIIEFRLLTSNGYSSKIISKKFNFPAKFYQTWWFFVLSILTVILIFYLFYKLIQSQTKRRERKKQEIQLMLSQMESKALRAQMNPHFIFNAMNSIQNFLLSDQEIEAVTFLGKFARLIRNILESTKSELITIKNEREILETYMELEQLRCSYSFDFEFNIDESISLETSQIPSMIIQPFIENAIIHGLIPLSERKGNLQISFTQDEGNYFCTVEDNGIGRKQAQINNEKNRKFHTSMGMGITFDRIEQIQKMYGKTVSIQIEDKSEVENNTTGTKIFITFPKLNLPL